MKWNQDINILHYFDTVSLCCIVQCFLSHNTEKNILFPHKDEAIILHKVELK